MKLVWNKNKPEYGIYADLEKSLESLDQLLEENFERQESGSALCLGTNWRWFIKPVLSKFYTLGKVYQIRIAILITLEEEFK